MEKLSVSMNLASELALASWVESVEVQEETAFSKDEKPKYCLRMIVHPKNQVSDYIDYQKLLTSILNDPLFTDKDFSLSKAFHEYCMYLSFNDDRGNTIDFVVSHPWCLKSEDKAKLYSDISGCEMVAKKCELNYESWFCKT